MLSYKNNDEKEKAIEIASCMASIFESKDVLMSDLLDGENKIINVQENLESALSLIQIEVLYKLQSNDENYNIKLLNQLIKIIKSFFENEEYGFYNLWLMKNYLSLGENYAKLKYKEQTIDAIENTIKHACAYKKRTGKKKYFMEGRYH